MRIEIYADGGVIGKNPSALGGVWAWCHVVGGEKVRQDSGLVRPEMFQAVTVTNNLTEFLSLLYAVESLEDDWNELQICSDSSLTLSRFQDPWHAGMAGIPQDLQRRACLWKGSTMVRELSARIGYTLLKGHPTKAELACGTAKDGRPVSHWNMWCDAECNRVKDTLFK